MPPRVVLVPDGMADEPLDELGGRTPLEAARVPNMDALAQGGSVGLVQTVPPGMAPGSDVANLAVLGYDPRAVYTGRSPLEAASIGVALGPDDVSYRCNFVTIQDGVMKDHTAGHIGNEDARRLIAALEECYAGSPFEFYAGVSYRNLMVWRGGEEVPCTPPHDILDQPVDRYLPRGDGGVALRRIQDAARGILAPLRPHTEVWLWGEGRAPRIPSFEAAHGVRGAVVGAVDLVRGLGVYAGLDVLEVPGATGDLNTDYGSKARVALRALARYDFVLVHVEAPDEAAHMGSLAEKVRAIERIDAEVLGPLRAAVQRAAILVLPDHYTPLRTRTHAGLPVPFAFAGGQAAAGRPAAVFTESAAAATGLVFDSGAALMDHFLAVTR